MPDKVLYTAEVISMFGLVVTLVISIPSLDQPATRELAEAAHQRCPYSRATRGNISVELRAL